jgi:hypothetical protein
MVENLQVMFDENILKRKRNHNCEVEELLKLSQRVEAVVKTVNHMNFSLKERYNNLKKKIKDKMKMLTEIISI